MDKVAVLPPYLFLKLKDGDYMERKLDFNIYATNITEKNAEHYNSSFTKWNGMWISLPMNDENLNQILQDKLSVADGEETGRRMVRGATLSEEISFIPCSHKFCDLHELNDLARMLNRMNDHELGVLKNSMDSRPAGNYSVVHEVCRNILDSADHSRGIRNQIENAKKKADKNISKINNKELVR